MNYIKELRQLIGTRPIIYTGVGILVFNNKKELLLHKNAITGEWGMIGGGLELGESFEEAAARELLEETGLMATGYKFVSVVSGKELYHKYPNGDEVYYAGAIYQALNVSGEPRPDNEEGIELGYMDLAKPLENLSTFTSTALKQLGYL